MRDGPHLWLAWALDEPDYGWLSCDAGSDGFAGWSEDFIGKKELLAFAKALEAFPIPADSPPSLLSGVSLPPMPICIDISVRPTSATGELTVFVKLRSNPDDFDVDREVTLSMQVEYAALPRFAAAIRAMVRQGGGEASLWAEA
jgi:hypothetical protein